MVISHQGSVVPPAAAPGATEPGSTGVHVTLLVIRSHTHAMVTLFLVTILTPLFVYFLYIYSKLESKPQKCTEHSLQGIVIALSDAFFLIRNSNSCEGQLESCRA